MKICKRSWAHRELDPFGELFWVPAVGEQCRTFESPEAAASSAAQPQPVPHVEAVACTATQHPRCNQCSTTFTSSVYSYHEQSMKVPDWKKANKHELGWEIFLERMVQWPLPAAESKDVHPVT